MESYKNRPLEDRKNQSAKLMAENPMRNPIIVTCTNGKLKLNKHEFLVPKQLKVLHFMATLRRSMNLGPENTIYLYVNNNMLRHDKLIGEVYEQYKDEDGFLYISLTDIPALGGITV